MDPVKRHMRALDRRTRRQFLRSGLDITGVAALSLAGCARAVGVAPAATAVRPVGGSRDPFPIPWLDANGSHNQMPGLGQEPSNIFHFRGHVARCNDFTGVGTDHQGNRIAFGAKSTDFSFLQGEYHASDRLTYSGTFTHI